MLNMVHILKYSLYCLYLLKNPRALTFQNLSQECSKWRDNAVGRGQKNGLSKARQMMQMAMCMAQVCKVGLFCSVVGLICLDIRPLLTLVWTSGLRTIAATKSRERGGVPFQG